VKIISLKLPEALNAKLTALIKQRGISKSALIREAIEDYVAHQGEPLTGSFTDLAESWCGSVDGPEDLSTGKPYLDGYGQ
jgi:predicted transcriptional regulator